MSKWGDNPLCKGYMKKIHKKFLGKKSVETPRLISIRKIPVMINGGQIVKKNFWDFL
jgi:hypothetical protein